MKSSVSFFEGVKA